MPTPATQPTFIPESVETEALAGFIEIRGNALIITPVEVFAIYDASSEVEIARDPALRPIELIEQNDARTLSELGLTLDDFPSGVHIRPTGPPTGNGISLSKPTSKLLALS